MGSGLSADTVTGSPAVMPCRFWNREAKSAGMDGGTIWHATGQTLRSHMTPVSGMISSASVRKSKNSNLSAVTSTLLPHWKKEENP